MNANGLILLWGEDGVGKTLFDDVIFNAFSFYFIFFIFFL